MIEPIGIPGRRGPVVLATLENEASPAAATLAARVAHRVRVDLRVCQTPSSSARTARELDATMIVLSAVPGRWASHRVSARRASWLIDRTGCAVASVSPTLVVLPRMCVAAMDFSAASIRAVQLALLVLDDCGTLTLVHVRPANDLSSPQHTVHHAETSDSIAARFNGLRAQLWEYAPPGAVIETQLESGEIVDQVLSVARQVNADLIVVGVHSPRASRRIFDFGSAADILRRAPCSVLASPIPRVARVFRGECGSQYWATAPEWSSSPALPG